MSTKGFSVYNVLHAAWQLQGAPVPLTTNQITSWLRSNWRADVTDEYVALGIGYLLAREFVTENNGKLASAQPGRKLRRTTDDVDLEWA